ncbi:uncharacterized protein LOC126661895 [Mercurialis annua]|uniref:uncharacterized protein LOC126661895 n=1 Tax=Mercurialis annua TaxID=3986 RepID=UPI00215F28EC|nr:uncharacterized protein LOC126661895 [Mercurialis annua]
MSESLASMVLKARYYPDCDFFHSCLGSNPSYVWRSIAGREIVQNGIIRKISDGTSTNIWADPWLPSMNDAYVKTARPDGTHIHLVPRADSWMWRKDRKGVFTVRSAYFQAFHSQHMVTSNAIVVSWKRFWKIATPPKVKNCLWRAISGNLPTCVALKEKVRKCFQGLSFCSGCLDMFFNSPNAIKHQNDVLRNKLVKSPADVVREANNFFNQWTSAKLLSLGHSVVHIGMTNSSWIKPSLGSLTCNVDAAVPAEEDYSSFGFLLRDHQGNCIAAKHAGVMDCQELVTALNNPLRDLSYFSDFVRDCHFLISTMDCVFVAFVKCSANLAAHCLAKTVDSMYVCREWDSPPLFLVSILQNDF